MRPRDTDAPRKPTETNGQHAPAPASAIGPPPPAPAPGGDEGRWTIGRLLTWTTDYLRRRKAEFPRLDAEVLLAHVLDWQRVQLYTHYEEEIGERARAAFRDLVRRRAEGAPVAYLVGRKEFYSLALKVSPAVLIPRPDTEFVVVEFLAALKGVESPRAADVGTGSGCIALACARHHRSARFVAIDVSPEALAVAAENARALDLADRIEFRQGDLLEPASADGPFDAIVSNPPYVASGILPLIDPGVRDFEPHLALDGGPDGLRVVARLIDQALPLLKPGGHLILEIGSDQEAPVRDLIASHPEFRLAPTVRDHANHPRVIRAARVAGDVEPRGA